MNRRVAPKRLNQLSCCAFDLETTSLNADFGIILCAVIKPGHHKKSIILRGDELNKKWKTDRADDSAICRAIHDELRNYDIWCAHNGSRFDVPFLRSRMALHKLEPLGNNFKLIDPVFLARNKMKISWNSLEKIADFLRIGTKKTPVPGNIWVRAALNGDKAAMDYVVEHCVRDVKILDEVLGRMKHYSSALNSYGSGF